MTCMAPGEGLTALLERAQGGDLAAAEALCAAAYPELRRLAHARLRGAPRSTLVDTTGLVHEWWLRFARREGVPVRSRAHFLRYASRAMRSIIVDLARRRRAARRGGGAARLGLSEGPVARQAEAGAAEILRVHEALEALAAVDARLAQVVELRFFGGLTEAEIAEVAGVTDRTVRRDWEKARLWLAEAMA